MAELLSCMGFFLVFFLEELVLLFFHTKHSHGGPVDQQTIEQSPTYVYIYVHMAILILLYSKLC